MTFVRSNLFARKPEKRVNRVSVFGCVTSIFMSDLVKKFYILQVRTDDGLVKIKGVSRFPIEVGAHINAGECIHSIGEFGAEYLASYILESAPTDTVGMTEFLMHHFESVQKSTISKLVNLYGPRTYDVIENHPEDAVKIGGISSDAIARVVLAIKNNDLLSNVERLCSIADFPAETAEVIVGAYKSNSIEVMENDCYRLVELKKIPFKLLDAFAKTRTLALHSKSRIPTAIEYVIFNEPSKRGDTAISRQSLVSEVKNITEVSDDEIEYSLREILSRSPSPLRSRIIKGVDCISLTRSASCEESISKNISRLLKDVGPNAALSEMAKNHAIKLNDSQQIEAATSAFLHGLSVITGGPGCGKTTVTKIIIDVAIQANLKIVACGPTNKSARRIEESTSLESNTLHSCLKAQIENESYRFACNASNPMDGDLFIVDEFSIIDNELARAFFDAVPIGARVVILGDSDQFGSIGPGSVLHDIISSGAVHTTILKTVHRTVSTYDSNNVITKESDINVIAKKIRLGLLSVYDFKNESDVAFTPAIDHLDIINNVVTSYIEMSSKLKTVQVLCARYGGEVGIDLLNERIRDAVNPQNQNVIDVKINGKLWRTGDRVITSETSKERSISCGEFGVIQKIEDQENHSSNRLEKVIYIRFGDKIVTHVQSEMRHIGLGYVMSVHKSIGCEFDGVILVVAKAHDFMLDRKHIFTGFTRAKKYIKIIGDSITLVGAVKKAGARRITGLCEEIQKVCKVTPTKNLLARKIGVR